MNKLVGLYLVAGAFWLVISVGEVYGQTSSRRVVIKTSVSSKETRSLAMLPDVGDNEDKQYGIEEVISESDKPTLDAAQPLERKPSQATALQSPREVLSLSTTLRTPASEVKTHQSPPAHASTYTPKWILLESDRFAHIALLFEEPIHERHGIAKRGPVQQLTKSTIAFFGRSLLLPGTLLTKKHLHCESGAGWRASQGERVCPVQK